MTDRPPTNRPNPFARPLSWPVTSLREADLRDLNSYVRRSDSYPRLSAAFEGCNLDYLIDRAAAHYLPNSVPLDAKIKKKTEYTAKQISAFREQLRDVKDEIRKLNSTQLPGGLTFIDLICELGDSDFEPIDIEESIALARIFECLPTYLEQYCEALNGWPHRVYRSLLSNRNWDTFPLAQLCLLVKAMTGDLHYDEVAELLTAVADFATAAQLKPERGEPFTADLIRHKVDGFRERNPAVWERLEERIVLLADTWQENSSSQVAEK